MTEQTMNWTTISAGDRFSFHCLEGGSGSPLLYLHGFEGHPGEAQFLKELAANHRVVAPELIGYGQSKGFEHIEEVLDMVLALRQLAEQLGGEVDVVGHSLGGMFAAELAAIAPQVVHRLVLVSPFGLWLEDQPIPDPFVLNADQLREITWHDPASATTARQPANGHDQITATLSRTGDLAVAGKFLWPIPDRGLRKRLPLVRAETLVLNGASDQLITPAYGEAFADVIDGAAATTIANAGHYPMLEQPGEFVQQVEGFLGR